MGSENPDMPPQDAFWDEPVWEDVEHRGRLQRTPDGLEVKCPVCQAPKHVTCVNPVTALPRRGNVSCLGRKERLSSLPADEETQ
jgi:hypothetical protein